MDFLNKAFAQLSDLFRSMTPAARITTGLLLVVVVVSLGYLVTFQMSGPDVYLFNGAPIPESERPAMLAAFAKKNLNSYVVVGNRIRVPRKQLDAYMNALDEASALPRSFGQDFDDALAAGNVFDSTWKQRKRDQYAKQKELARILRSWPDIANAQVIIDAETTSGFPRKRVVTAGVNVTPKSADLFDAPQAAEIRKFMLGAVAGLTSENVKISANGRTFAASDLKSGGGVSDNVYFGLKQLYKTTWENDIRRALEYIPGLTVTANVLLDRERINRTQKVTHEPKGLIVRDVTEEKSRTREDNTSGGRVGFEAQQPNVATTLTASQSSGPQETEDESKRETITIANTQQMESEKIGLTPTRVSVAIGVPSSYIENIWKKRNPTPEGQEPQTPDQAALKVVEDEQKLKIQQTVAAVLPEVEGLEDKTELVVVNTFADLPGEEIPEPGLSESALGWFGRHWGTLGIIGLALFSLVMLRSMIRSVPTGPMHAAGAVTLPAESDEEEDESPAPPAAKRLSRFSGSGRSLRDELSEIVQEDPDAAANILRTWIGSAT